MDFWRVASWWLPKPTLARCPDCLAVEQERIRPIHGHVVAPGRVPQTVQIGALVRCMVCKLEYAVSPRGIWVPETPKKVVEEPEKLERESKPRGAVYDPDMKFPLNTRV